MGNPFNTRGLNSSHSKLGIKTGHAALTVEVPPWLLMSQHLAFNTVKNLEGNARNVHSLSQSGKIMGHFIFFFIFYTEKLQ